MFCFWGKSTFTVYVHCRILPIMSNITNRGPCPRCHHLNVYTQSKCDVCGARLLWADTFAVTAGEKCPQCQHFNTYLISQCDQCQSRLPWADSPAAKRSASGKADAQQRSLVITILCCAILFIIFCGWMIYSLTVSR